MNRAADFPKWDAPEVAEAAEELLTLSRADDRLNVFHRQYFAGSLTRLAMNLVFLRRLIQPGDTYLDVGSFGLEPALIKDANPDCTVKALSYEGNIIGLGPDGFFETADPDVAAPCVVVDRVDIERDAFPYPDRYFDVVSCFEVLEHLKFTPIRMLKEIKRVLRDTGLLVLTTPNISSARSFLRMVRGHSPQESPYFHSDPQYGVKHPKEYTVAEVRGLLASLGFAIRRLRTLDMQRPGREERFAAGVVRALAGLLRVVSRQDPQELHFGEKIIVFAHRGGSIVTETPRAIFDESE
jgi:SAM-dependent methyltransferase